MSTLLCLGRHTLTGWLTTSGQQFADWTAAYRLFSADRLPVPEIFSVIRRNVLAQLPTSAPLAVALDDTLLRKRGTHIPGVAWRRDPLGPPFQTNFVRAQRVLPFSAALPLSPNAYRMVPIGFHHAPTPPKPSRKASDQQRQHYRQQARRMRLSLQAAHQIAALRQALDAEPDGAQRPLRLFVDGGYTNATVLKKLPARTTLIGRIRKDAKLYTLPPPSPTPQRGRPRRYGAPASTPEQVRTNDAMPWRSLEISINGVAHSLRVKGVPDLLWRTAGLQHTLQLVVIAPLGYRLRKGSRLLYKRPAFLICTDPQLDLHSLVQGYIQRWDIEVNFREEKTLLGVGQAQVRHKQSVEDVPALQVASYALLLLATRQAFPQSASPGLLPRPKWANAASNVRFSTARAIHQLRAEVWGHALGLRNFSGFADHLAANTKPEKFPSDPSSALFYATN
ncbi:MAG TPA: transposase [Bryobacteraceae bacterium]|nr:transposase [Bryobacteraceae bacterium]